jgi:hypothetical protein
MKWHEFQYDDTCLDMGGGRNPEETPICIVKEVVMQKGVFTLDAESEKLLGPWLILSEDRGFTLYDDGTASSINSATLVYHKWRIKEGELCLTERSIGNHTQSVSEECESYSIKGKGGKAKLIIGNSEFQTIYNRT